jgi:hypothetical protein
MANVTLNERTVVEFHREGTVDEFHSKSLVKHNESQITGTAPYDIWKAIFSCLDAQNLLKIQTVCREFKILTDDYVLWRNICLEAGLLDSSNAHPQNMCEGLLSLHYKEIFKKSYLAFDHHRFACSSEINYAPLGRNVVSSLLQKQPPGTYLFYPSRKGIDHLGLALKKPDRIIYYLCNISSNGGKIQMVQKEFSPSELVNYVEDTIRGLGLTPLPLTINLNQVDKYLPKKCTDPQIHQSCLSQLKAHDVWRNTNREQTAEILRGEAPGTFIIRPSSQEDEDFVISYVDEWLTMRHISYQISAEKEYFSGTAIYDDLDTLLRYQGNYFKQGLKEEQERSSSAKNSFEFLVKDYEYFHPSFWRKPEIKNLANFLLTPSISKFIASHPSCNEFLYFTHAIRLPFANLNHDFNLVIIRKEQDPDLINTVKYFLLEKTDLGINAITRKDPAAGGYLIECIPVFLSAEGAWEIPALEIPDARQLMINFPKEQNTVAIPRFFSVNSMIGNQIIPQKKSHLLPKLIEGYYKADHLISSS